MAHYFVFRIDNQRYGVVLSAVEKVIRAVELISLPDAPDTILGLINMRGDIIPAVNIRKKFRLPERETEINDRIIICLHEKRRIAFFVDMVEGVFEFSKHQLNEAAEIFPEMEQFIEGIGKIGNDTVIVYKVGQLFATAINGYQSTAAVDNCRV